jgi:3-oxocholest-4-en-26-oyl-CoA dehydrogenase beta subunit
VAAAFLVPVETPDGVAVFLVEPGDEGVTVTPQRFSDGDEVARLDLSGVAVSTARQVGPADGSAAERLRHLLLLAGAAEQLGITEGALALTAAYAKTREQFGRPIGTFQAVSQRLADGFIDVLAQRLSLWQAVWRLSEGVPAATEVAVAKLWAADAGHRLAHTTVHVHGGVGIDLDGEAHRYFTSAKRFEFLYGGATDQALAIGGSLADQPA